MYLNENVITKMIATEDGEAEFQVRYLRDEQVGVVSTPSGSSYFLLDSAEHWYDLIQETYPPVLKCSCKNDWFCLTLDYTPRAGTEDIREVSIHCRCTACQKTKSLLPIEIDYSPSIHLLDTPLLFCRQPKIKYKTYRLAGYWSQEELMGLAGFLMDRHLHAYGWYWDSHYDHRYLRELSVAELESFLTENREPCLAVYFSEEPLNPALVQDGQDGLGTHIPHDIWRKTNMFVLNGPYRVIPYGLLYEMVFCGEYLDKDGEIHPKSPAFQALIQDFRKYAGKLLKK